MDEDAKPLREEMIRLPIDPEPAPTRRLFEREPKRRVRVDDIPRIEVFAAEDLIRPRETMEDRPG